MTHRRRPLDVGLLVQQYSAGMTITQLGVLVDRAPSTVYQRLRGAGVVFRGRQGVPRKPSTQVQAQILDVIKTYVRRRGFAPSVREITAAVGFKSDRSTQYRLQQLEERGLIRRTAGVARGITVLQGTEVKS